VSNMLKYAALAVFMGSIATPALADKAETKGGLKIKTDDGRFEMGIGGRIHYDLYFFSEDDQAAFGSAGLPNRGGADFRRTYLTLTGKAYGWKYKFETDFAADSGAGKTGYREMWVSTNVGPGELILGQFKPFRGMEELTSSNEITLIERPTTTASGIYAGRQFQMGAGYKGLIADQFGYGVHVVSLAAAGTGPSEGMGYGGRAYWFPVATDTQTLHLGLAYSSDREDSASAGVAATFNYGGRRGVSQTLAGAGSAITTGSGAGFGEQDTLALELAGAFGPFTAQAEYAKASFSDAFASGTPASPQDADVTAYYVQGSWMVTGESKPYKKDRGAFGNPKPNGDYGAWEVVARYEIIENDDTSATTTGGCSRPATIPATTPATTRAISSCDISQITLGVNWYVNPSVRFMLNYYMAEADLGGAGANAAGKDEPDAITLRTQLSF